MKTKTRTPETLWTQPPQGASRDIDVEALLTDGTKRVIKVRASTNALAFHLAGQRLHHEETQEVTEMRIA